MNAYDAEPTAAELAAIEAEWPVIEAELGVLDAEIAALTAAGGPGALDGGGCAALVGSCSARLRSGRPSTVRPGCGTVPREPLPLEVPRPGRCPVRHPTYPWRCAPDGLATRRQLAAAGLRPGGQPVAAQIMWPSSGPGVAYLYRLDLARPKRTPTAAQLAALGKALAARRTCPQCTRDAGYVLPAREGRCNDCAARPVDLEVAA